MAGFCEHGNENLGFIKGGKFIEYLSDYYLLKKNSAPWSWYQLWALFKHRIK